MYLNGEISEDPRDINGYASSAFFGVDRYTSFMQDWKKDYENGTIIVLDRYTTSNAVHQMSKLDKKDWDSFMDWLFDFEYNKLAIPSPDKIIYLDMNPDVSQKLLKKRYNGDDSKKDIHEKNVGYIKACRPAAMYAAKRFCWDIISCDDGENPFSIEEIAEKIKSAVNNLLQA